MFEKDIKDMNKEEMAEEYLKLRMEHFKNKEAEKAATEELEKTTKERNNIKDEIKKYFE